VNVEEGLAVIVNSNSLNYLAISAFPAFAKGDGVVHTGFWLMYIVTTMVYPLIFRDIVRELGDR